VRSLDVDELDRALDAATAALLTELRRTDAELAAILVTPLRRLADPARR
jgi:hypothetical protein